MLTENSNLEAISGLRSLSLTCIAEAFGTSVTQTILNEIGEGQTNSFRVSKTMPLRVGAAIGERKMQ